MLNISHLGQVSEALLGKNSHVSILYYKDEDVQPGLPILPKEWNEKTPFIKIEGLYACSLCGFTFTLPVGEGGKCTFVILTTNGSYGIMR